MRRYNLMRPILLLCIGFGVKLLVTNIALLFGATPEAADNIGFLAMLIAVIITFTQMNKRRRR